MEIDEDVIPASPRVADKYEVSKRKRRRRKDHSNQNNNNNTVETCADNSDINLDAASASTTKFPVQPNIYFGIDSESEGIEPVIPQNFDVLEVARLKESVKDVELKQGIFTQNNNRNSEFVVAKDYILSQSSQNNKIHELNLNDIQFSEWILPPQSNRVQMEKLESPKAASVVESILTDFQLQSFEDNCRDNSPPILLVKKEKVRKMYTRKRNDCNIIENYPKISDERQENYEKDIDLDQNISEDVDIDLSSSKLIVANLHNLSAFFTQSETISFDLEQNIISQEESIESDDHEEQQPIVNEFCHNEKHLLNEDEDIFADIKSPHGFQILRSQKRKISPLVTKDNLPITPVVTKMSKSITFLQPKKLKFDADLFGEPKADNSIPSSSFATPEAKRKKSAGIFDDIFDEFKDMGNEIDETNNFTRFKTANSKAIVITPNIPKKSVKWSDSIESLSMPKNGLNGFKTAAGNRLIMPEKSFRNAAGIFDDIMDEFKLDNIYDGNDEFNDFKMSTLGFSKASHSRMESDIEMGNSKHFSNDDSALESPINPMRVKFATSTPNPSRNSALMKSITITPIARTKNVTNIDQECLEFLRGIEDNSYNELFSDFPTKSQQSGELEEKPSLGVSEIIKVRRREALARQQADCLRKSEVRLHSGYLYNLKKNSNITKFRNLGLPKMYSAEKLIQLGVHPKAIDLNSTNALELKFDATRHYSKEICEKNVNGIQIEDGMCLLMDENCQIGLTEMNSAFLQCDSVDPKLIPDNWIPNAIKWILVKLSSYERSFPELFAGKTLTPENVLSQLKYRYDQEIDQAKRSAIRKIVEQDDIASKRMILFVSFIMQMNPIEYALELCDGWYSMRTDVLDEVLSKAVRSGKIKVGTKLMVQGAELIGAEEACSPLEMPSSIALKISANSTRRARWYTKLGFCKDFTPISISFNSIESGGGSIARGELYVSRVYPILYFVKGSKEQNGDFNTSKNVFRSEKLERKCNKLNDRKRFEDIEELYSTLHEEVDKEFEMIKDVRKLNSLNHQNISEVEDAEDLCLLLEASHDAVSLEDELSTTQRKMINDYRQKIYCDKLNEISRRAKQKIENNQSTSSTPLLRMRVVDVNSIDRTGILTIWNLNESINEIKENTAIELTHFATNGNRGKDILLSTNNRTTIQTISQREFTDLHELSKRKCVELESITNIEFKPIFNEIDCVVYILSTEVKSIETRFQSVYAVDDRKNILKIKFWNKISDYGYDDVVQEGRFIAIHNLDWRSTNARRHDGIVQVFVTEITTFSEMPKSEEMINAMNGLKDRFNEIENLDEYLEECLMITNQNKNIPFVSSKTNSCGNRATTSAINSFGMTKQQTLTQIKMDKLKNVGEAPPPPAFAFNRNTSIALSKPFKSPMATVAVAKDNNHHNRENNY